MLIQRNVRTIKLVNMGQVLISRNSVLKADISTCVTVCLFHKKSGTGGMTHISKAGTCSPNRGKLLQDGFYFCSEAIKALVALFQKECGLSSNRDLAMVLTGGLDGEPPLMETIEELGLKFVDENTLRTRSDSRYKFKLMGWDINNKYYRNVLLDPMKKCVTVVKHLPFDMTDNGKKIKEFFL